MEVRKVEEIYFLRSGKVINKIDLTNVDYVLSYGNFCKFYFNNQYLLVSMTLNEVEERFAGKEFVRVHRSCIVPLQKIEKIVDNVIYIGSVCLPIGRVYREEFYKKILG
jgi:DNA-binding LytR/AlgR family response regulator